jgi:hypothetical protein
MIDLFSFLPLKGLFNKIIYSFSTCCGGLLSGSAVYSKIRYIRETGFTRAPLFEKS